MLLPDPDKERISLAALQKQFWASCRKYKNDIYPLVQARADFTQEMRMDVYRTTARSAHVSALMDSYPVCRAILGDDYFKHIAKLYFSQTLSYNADMNVYGGSFPGYIAHLYGLREELQGYLYLAGLARLEWEFQKIYFATDATVFDVNKFQAHYQCRGENAVLKLQPCLSIMSSSFRIYEIWDMHRRGEVDKEIVAGCRRQYLCIYKHNYEVKIEKVNPEIYELLVHVCRQKTIAEIASSFQGRYDLNEALTTVLEKQWLTS